MTRPQALFVNVNGFRIRVWHAGGGPKLGFLAGFGGLPRWIPFLDRLAQQRTVIVPSLPGFPGGDSGHTVLDSHLDWVLAVRRIVQCAGLDGADLAGSSVGGAFAAEIAAIWPTTVRRMALIAPFGLFDEKEPITDPWAQRPGDVAALMCAEPGRWNELKAQPQGTDALEWQVEQTRADAAAARAFWPLGNTRLVKRLPLIESPTLLIWGERDRIVPRSYANGFAAAIGGRTNLSIIAGAGHLAELDRPDETAEAILEWTMQPRPPDLG